MRGTMDPLVATVFVTQPGSVASPISTTLPSHFALLLLSVEGVHVELHPV